MNITTNNKLKLYWFCTKNPSKSCFLLPLWLEIEEVTWSMKKQWHNILIWYSYCLQRLLLYLQLLSNDVYDHRSNWFVHFSMVRFDPLFISQKTVTQHFRATLKTRHFRAPSTSPNTLRATVARGNVVSRVSSAHLLDTFIMFSFGKKVHIQRFSQASRSNADRW